MPLDFHPDDDYSIPLMGDVKRSSGYLVKVTLPTMEADIGEEKTGQTTKRSRPPRTKTVIPSASSSSAALSSVPTFQAVGRVVKRVKYVGLSDFQILGGDPGTYERKRGRQKTLREWRHAMLLIGLDPGLTHMLQMVPMHKMKPNCYRSISPIWIKQNRTGRC